MDASSCPLRRPGETPAPRTANWAAGAPATGGRDTDRDVDTAPPADARDIDAALAGARHLAVIAGGFIGCEIARTTPHSRPRRHDHRRQSERGSLKDRLDRAARGAPQVVLVDGPAGIGKISLARCFQYGVASDCCVGSGQIRQIPRS